MHIRHTLDPGVRRSGVELSLVTAERSICSANGAFSPERHYQGDFSDVSVQIPGSGLEDLLDKIYLVIEQGGLGYGGGDNGDL